MEKESEKDGIASLRYCHFLRRHSLCVYEGIMLESCFGHIRQERKKREEVAKGCSAQLHKLFQEELSEEPCCFSSCTADKSLEKAMLEDVCFSAGCHGPRLSYTFCISLFSSLSGR